MSISIWGRTYLNKLKAKPNLSISAHLEDADRVFQMIWDQNELFFQNFFRKHELDIKEVAYYLRFAVYAHDIGKAHKDWQDYLVKKKKHVMSHPLVSFCVCWEMFEQKFGKSLLHYPLVRGALTSVLAHHHMLHNNSYGQVKKEKKIMISKEVINEFIVEINVRFNMQKKIQPFSQDLEWTGLQLSKRVEVIKNIHLSWLSKESDEIQRKEKLIHTLFLSILCACDNIASKVADHLNKEMDMLNPMNPTVTEETVKKYADDWLQEINPTQIRNEIFLKPNELQKQMFNHMHPYMIIRAGCGEGKTAAALQFANYWVGERQARKVIFTLPTRFTTNEMFKSITDPKKYNYPKNQVGIYHSEAEQFLQKIAENSDFKEIDYQDDYLKDEIFQNTFYHRPVTISTIDHLVFSFIHSFRYADRAFGNILQSVVIFDEIHFYDEQTLKGIYECIRLLRQYQVPHLIMSATLPDSFIRQLNLLDSSEPYVVVDSQSSLAHATPFQIEKIEQSLYTKELGLSMEAKNIIERNLNYRQMVILNQVERAKKVAQELMELHSNHNILCYHSEFSSTDRAIKEKLIAILFEKSDKRSEDDVNFLLKYGFSNVDACILVTTQICEMSLDISSDVQLTDLAPIDAISQRGGRLHRMGMQLTRKECDCQRCKERSYLPKDYMYKQYLFNLGEKAASGYPYVNKQDWEKPDHILHRSWKILGSVNNFHLVQEWMNHLYPELDCLHHPQLIDYFYEDIVFGKTPRERYGNEDEEQSQGSFQLRPTTFLTRDVIPAIYLSVIRSEIKLPDRKLFPQEKKELYHLLKKYTVSIKDYRLGQCRAMGRVRGEKHGEFSFIYLDVPYDGNGIGFDFQSDAKTSHNIC